MPPRRAGWGPIPGTRVGYVNGGVDVDEVAAELAQFRQNALDVSADMQANLQTGGV